jgi:NAD(P)-dependent dehydrogenase (short-subunit alcohol dehydrogenase family)
MDFGLQGKTALVLGGGGGLGRAIARSLAREGARVAVGDIDEGALEQTVEAIGAEGSQGLPLPWDLADLALIDERVGTIERRLGPVDILVNNRQRRARPRSRSAAMAARKSMVTWWRSSRASGPPTSPARSSAWTAA